MCRQVLLGREYAERDGCHPLSDQFAFTRIAHPDDEVEIARR